MSMDAYCRLVQRELFGFGKNIEKIKALPLPANMDCVHPLIAFAPKKGIQDARIQECLQENALPRGREP